MPYPTDTIAALATPMGTSAIAVVRASGPGVAELTASIFGNTLSPRTAQHADYRAASGVLLDDVLFTYFAGPHSFTGEDTLEISCHGNPFIAQKILEDLFVRGCRAAEPGEFSQRGFLNGRMDLSQAEAIMDLIHARSERALAAANQQLRGALGRQMEAMIRELVAVIATVEAYIDFPEEDLPEENKMLLRKQLDGLIASGGRLLATRRYGAMLREGIKTVIVGDPNAGKSSLLNRLVGRERALVSPEAGTTRDYLEEPISIGSHTFRLIDTAGLNDTPTPLERRGIDKTLEQVGEADLFLWVIDVTRPAPTLPDAVASRLRAENAIIVLNKADQPPGPLPALPAGVCFLRMSALTGAGIDELKARMDRLANAFATDTGEELVAVNARHAFALETAQNSLAAARVKISEGSPSELLASDLRAALDAFGEIAGRIDNEQVFDQLFSAFCIGK